MLLAADGTKTKKRGVGVRWGLAGGILIWGWWYLGEIPKLLSLTSTLLHLLQWIVLQIALCLEGKNT